MKRRRLIEMIYLSGGGVKKNLAGLRRDLGLMFTFGIGATIAESLRGQLLAYTWWAADNNCYNDPDIDIDAYLDWLDSYRDFRSTCLFAPAPDVVGDAEATMERARPVLKMIRGLGFRAALVAQDGLERMRIDWEELDTLFVGGTTSWKLSPASYGLIEEANRRGKWTHMGRVNTRRRIRIAAMSGCKSVDGTKLAYAPDRNLMLLARWLDEINRQPFLIRAGLEGGFPAKEG